MEIPGPALTPVKADPTTIVLTPDHYRLPFSATLLSKRESMTDRNPVIPRCK